MGQISYIKQQVKRENRFSVYVDGKYVFSLARDQLVQLGLKVGQDLSSDDVSRFKEASSLGKLRDLTYKWLSIRPRSDFEISQYLNRKTDDTELVEKIKQELKDYGYINDNKFAEAWVRGRTATKPMSSYRLRQELIQKRVPKEVINEVIGSSSHDDLAAAKEVVAKRSTRYKDKQKLMAYMSRQGFSYDVIKQALETD